MTAPAQSPATPPPVLTPVPRPPRFQSTHFEAVPLRRKRQFWRWTIGRDYHPLQAQAFEEVLDGQQALTMVMIPDGIFLMGASLDETGSSMTATPQHLVTVAAFAMSQFPVTQAQWRAVMGTNPAYFQGDHRPVEMVSRSEATEFCRRLQTLTGRYYRLPSEAEWE